MDTGNNADGGATEDRDNGVDAEEEYEDVEVEIGVR